MQQRKDRRIKQWNKAKIKALAGGSHPFAASEVEALTYDLSLSGARIHSAERFDVGTRLRLHIELLRTRETLNIEGRVKWLRRNESESGFEMGVEFYHANSQTIMSLMKNLHDASAGNAR